jgi:hypothetical protein
MGYRLLPLVLMTILLAGTGLAYGQGFDYDAYEPRTLAEMIKKYDGEDLRDMGKAKDGSMIFGASFPSQVKVIYTGSSRKIPAERKSFIEAWVKTHEMPPEIAQLFETEHLFIENSVQYWLPVQKQVASYFDKELKKGEQVTLFAVITGGKKIDGKWDWIVLVNEFEK